MESAAPSLSKYELALDAAWNHLLDWSSQGRFKPTNEEDIQCFLYHALVLQLGTAVGVRPKPTTDKPPNLGFAKGKRPVGDMHFPDFLLGDPGQEAEVAVEIKFKARHAVDLYAGCKRDIQKLRKHHGNRAQYFLLYDEHPDHVFLDQYQHGELYAIGEEKCKLLCHPKALNPSPHKATARKAIATMRQDGRNFVEMGKANAKKAMRGK